MYHLYEGISTFLFVFVDLIKDRIILDMTRVLISKTGYSLVYLCNTPCLAYLSNTPFFSMLHKNHLK